MTYPIHVAIDGPSGTGKGTAAGALAGFYNGAHFDAGAIFRTFVLHLTKEMGITVETFKKSLLNKLDLGFDKDGFHIDGIHYGDEIRADDISKTTAIFASEARGFKRFVLDFEKGYIQDHRNETIIGDGRDLASVIMPDADIKIYLYADANIRADRRLNQLRGENPGIDYKRQDILEGILERDRRDFKNKEQPLMTPEDALKKDSPYTHVINTDKLSISDQFEVLGSLIDEKLEELGNK